MPNRRGRSMSTDHQPRSTDHQPRVVIIGAGFGGLNAARALKDAPVRVIVIDRQNHHLFQPLLYQVATAAAQPERHRLTDPPHPAAPAERRGNPGRGDGDRRGGQAGRPGRRGGPLRSPDCGDRGHALVLRA